jgi:hypothetical protein
MVTLSRTAQTLLRLPLVEAGDHLDQVTFHERYKAMPEAFRAELIGGDADGIFRSRVFPGLWLHANALLQRDGVTVIEVLRQGLATPEHAAFVRQLQERRATT